MVAYNALNWAHKVEESREREVNIRKSTNWYVRLITFSECRLENWERNAWTYLNAAVLLQSCNCIKFMSVLLLFSRLTSGIFQLKFIFKMHKLTCRADSARFSVYVIISMHGQNSDKQHTTTRWRWRVIKAIILYSTLIQGSKLQPQEGLIMQSCFFIQVIARFICYFLSFFFFFNSIIF